MPHALPSRWRPCVRAGAQPCSRVRPYAGASLLAIAMLVVGLLAPGAARGATAPWTAITAPGSTNTTVNPASDIFWDGTNLWSAWGTDGFDVEVRRWDGASWTSYGQPVNELTKNKMPSITYDGAKPWVAWNDDSYNTQVAWWNGAGWTTITSPGTGTSIFSTPDLLWANGALHVAYQDSGRVVHVKRWTGAVWTDLGSPGNGGTANSYPNLGWSGTELYVTWSQPDTALVSRLAGGTVWTAHSSLNLPGVGNMLPTIMFVGSRIYIAHEISGGGGISWWDGAQYRSVPTPGGGPTSFAYQTIEWTGSRIWMSHTNDPDDVEVAYVDPVAPNAPTLASLGQREADGTTTILTGAWTRFGAALNLLLRSTMVDPQSSEQLTPWVEVQPNATAFSATCGQQLAGATWIGPQVAAPTGGTGVTGIATVTGLVNGTSYKWRSCTVDRFGFTSGWTSKGGNPDLRIDTSVPTVALVSPANGATSVSRTPTLSATYTDAAPSTDGTVEFELCTTSGCGTVLQSGTSAPTANGLDATFNITTLAATTTYWWRARPTDSAANVGSWSAARSFTTEAATLTISVDSGTVALGMNYAGVDASGSSVITVTTDSPGGYQLVARDEDDAWGANSGAVGFVPDWTGTAGTPTTWNPGVTGGFGVTVLGTTGPSAKDPRWGTGTLPTHYTTNKYAGLDATVDGPIHTRASLSLPADTVTVGWRLNVPAGQAAGNYDATVVWTATALP